MSRTDESMAGAHMDVDKRIDETLEMAWTVIRADDMTRSEKVRELHRLADRAVWLDEHRELHEDLDTIADVAAGEA